MSLANLLCYHTVYPLFLGLFKDRKMMCCFDEISENKNLENEVDKSIDIFFKNTLYVL